MTWSHMVYNVQIDPAMSTMSHHAQREDVRLLPRCTHMMCNGRTCDHMWPTYRQSDAKAAHMSEGLCPDMEHVALRAYPPGVCMDCSYVLTLGQGPHESMWNTRTRRALDCVGDRACPPMNHGSSDQFTLDAWPGGHAYLRTIECDSNYHVCSRVCSCHKRAQSRPIEGE